MHKIFNTVAGVMMAMIMMLQPAAAQDTAKAGTAPQASMESRINAKNFVFVAQSVSPMRGGLRQLTSYYDVKVSGDTLVSNLPYFGRAYTAPINPSQGALSFTSVSYAYTVKSRKNGGRDVTIKTRDQADNQTLSFVIFDNNNASLQVTGNNRQPISFSGYVNQPKQDK